MNSKVKAILFDSGRVLNGPASGHWFITPNFFSFVDKKAFLAISNERLQRAFKLSSQYILKQSLITTEEEEYMHFLEFYRIFFDELPEIKKCDEQIPEVAKDLVYNYDKYTFFKDAAATVPELSTDYKLAVVSDAWPSLENVFKKAGFRDYFSSFVISSKLGITKPNEQMYKTALDELEVSPQEAIFIDDSIKNCDGAKALGIKTFLLCRDLKLYIYNKLFCRNHTVIRGINELRGFL